MLKDLKDLKAFFKLCRKQGVTEISFEGVSVKFGELSKTAAEMPDEDEEIPTESLTPDQLMFYAVEGQG